MLAATGEWKAEALLERGRATKRILEGILAGNVEPLYEAYGKRHPLEDLRQTYTQLVEEWKQERGDVQKIVVLATLPDQNGDLRSYFRIEQEQGSVSGAYIWQDDTLRGRVPGSRPPGTIFYPTGETSFHSFSLQSSGRSRLEFIPESGAVHLKRGERTLKAARIPAPRQPMTAVQMLNIPDLSDARLSPDGKEVVYVLSRSDWKENRQIPHLWMAGVEGGESRQLTFGEKGEQSPEWSPDGKTISFLARRSPAEETQIYLLPRNGGEGRQLTSHETAVSSLSWSPDGSGIYFLASDPKTEEEKKREEVQDDVYAFDENYKQGHLWQIRLDNRKEARVADGDFSILSYRLSPSGSRVLVQRAPSPLIDDSDEGEVWIMETSGHNPRRMTGNGISESGARLSPDEKRILFTAGSNGRFESYYNDNLFLLPVEEGRARLVMPDFPYAAGRATWSADGRPVFLIAAMGVHSQLLEIDLEEGTHRQLTQGDHSLAEWEFSPHNGLHLFTRETASTPGDLWILDGSGETRQLTHHFDYLKEQFLLPRQERLEWKGADGVKVEGLLLYPIHYQLGRRYPLVVQTHGGPQSADKFGLGASTSRYNPVLAARGYAVLKPNYRGSTGYGNAFLRDMVGHYFNQAHLDVMAGVDHVIELGIADPDRLVKMGWSAGGHMTNKIITFTDRFKAASSGAGAVNWISMYGQSDVRIYRTPWFLGSPWQQGAPIETYWENSPLKDIWKVKTPTLILVGEKDVRVPPPQSVELYRALKANGVPTRLYMAPRQPHGWRELRHRLFKINVELDWFARHALGEEYEWEKAPPD